ncbi:hypothetical protein [Gorillibacterium sp. CAU 1737]|uniref:putative amidoligase domain-containing protein n=1 Tax=Gorillibacterium sp. CAU 1737 TaxID=3140362 RepID=UPI00326126E0
MKCFWLHAGEKGIERLTGLLTFPNGSKLPADAEADVVIRYGRLAPEPASPVLLGRLAPILRILRGKGQGDLLRECGLKPAFFFGTRRSQADSSVLPPSVVWEYRIPVFQQEALTVYGRKAGAAGEAMLVKQGDQRFRELPDEERQHRARRAMKDAVRAVYALGLDYALVTVLSTAESETWIAEVDAMPDWRGEWTIRFAEAFNRFAAEEWPEKPSLLLGADPEFLLVSESGKVVPASRYLDRQGKVGCDAVILSGHRVILPLAELRPAPSLDVAGLVRSLRRTMRAAAQRIPSAELAWLAGGMPVKGLPLGGHIHFSGVPLTSPLLRALDNYGALPLLLLEGEGSRGRRPRYGRLGDSRRKSHGGFEYRPLPSWLASPELAAGVLALARTIVLHWRELRQDPLLHPGLRRRFYRGDADALRETAARLWAELEPLAAYREQAKELAWLKRQLFAEPAGRGLIDSGGDIRAAWGIGAADYTLPESLAAPLRGPLLKDAALHPLIPELV